RDRVARRLAIDRAHALRHRAGGKTVAGDLGAGDVLELVDVNALSLRVDDLAAHEAERLVHHSAVKRVDEALGIVDAFLAEVMTQIVGRLFGRVVQGERGEVYDPGLWDVV